MEHPTHLTYFLVKIQESLGILASKFPIETHKLYHLVLCEFIDKKRSILLSSDSWDTETIVFLFHFFKKTPQLPKTFFKIMSQLICNKKNWKPNQIATILRLME